MSGMVNKISLSTQTKNQFSSKQIGFIFVNLEKNEHPIKNEIVQFKSCWQCGNRMRIFRYDTLLLISKNRLSVKFYDNLYDKRFFTEFN